MSKPLRALWIVDSLEAAIDTAGFGTFAKAADPSRLRIELLVLRSDGERTREEEFRRRGCRVERLGARGILDPRAFLGLQRRIRDGDYDVIHTHLPWSSIWGAAAAGPRRVPVLATLYSPSVSHEAHAYADRRDRWAVRAIRRWARRVIVRSGFQWDGYIRDRTFPRALLEVVHPGVAIPEVAAPDAGAGRWLRERAGFPHGGPVALTVSALEGWECGVDDLLWAVPKVLAAVPQARFVIVGTGALRDELERRTRARGLNRFIHWAGEEHDLPRILAGSDLYIQPGHRGSSSSGLLQAMAAGLAVVGTRVGEVPEMVGSHEAAELAPRADPEALASSIVGILRDPGRLAAMGAAARHRVTDELSARAWVGRMEGVYQGVVAEARAGAHHREWNHACLSVELLALARGA